MARPVQLRYNDAQDGETVIGTYLTDDNLIDGGMLKNSGSGEYTRLEISGDRGLKDNLPIDYSQYATAENGENEPEILVYVYEKSTGNWKKRDRVFPEDAGTIEDNGDYTNENLYGFQKWVGRKRITGVSQSNATITDIVNALLPSGYTAETPAGDTVPTVENYTFNGKIDRALRDIIRDYPVKIWFTAELDANNDYIVKVQSKGFGGVVQSVEFTDERKTEGYQIIKFEEEDKSNIINKVEVEGVDANSQTIREVVEDTNSINTHGERFIHRSVGYLEDSTQANNLANDILSPEPSPHAEMAVPFIDENALNASIDVLDDRYGIDAVYTVVKQRDYFTDSRTEVELGFEKNRSESRRDSDRDLDEQNHRLFPTTTTDVGDQTIDTNASNTTTAQGDITASDEDRSPNTSGSTGLPDGDNNYVFNSNIVNQSLTAGNTRSVFDNATNFSSGITEYILVDASVFIDSTDINSGDFTITIENTDSNDTYFNETFFNVTLPTVISPTIMERDVVDGEEIRTQIEVQQGAAYSLNLNQTIDSVRFHDHTTSGSADSHGHNPDANDAGHGDTNDPSTHNLEGSTEPGQNINVATEDKTDR